MSGGLALVLTGYALGIAWLLWRIETTPPVCRHTCPCTSDMECPHDCDCNDPDTQPPQGDPTR